MPADTTHSANTGWVLAIVQALAECRAEQESVLSGLGMDPELLNGGHFRYSQAQLSALWRLAIDRHGDDFCLRVAAEVRPSTFHVVGYVMNCSATLRRALQRFARYCRLISDSAAATLSESDDCATLTFHFDTGGQPPLYQTVDTVLAAVFGFARWIVEGNLSAVAVHKRRAPPADPGAYIEFFGGPVFYNQTEDSLVFRRADLDRPVRGADEELATLLDGAASRHLESRMADRVAVRVRDLLLANLPHGALSKAEIADTLHMSERTLLRRLKEESTTFTDVLNQLRVELAFRHLQKDGLTIAETAYRLGFSDEGTFSRAFKRWTGRRPSIIRRDSLP